MKFTKEEQKIAKFLLEYLSKTHGKQMTVCLVDAKDIFCATNFKGKKMVEMGVTLIEMGNDEMKASENNEYTLEKNSKIHSQKPRDVGIENDFI